MTEHTCPDCGRSFDTDRGVGIHRGQAHAPDDPPWRDADTLREMYHGCEMNLYEIADELDCDPVTVFKWMDRHDIETRGNSSAQRLRYGNDAPVSFKWHKQGYPTAYFNHENTYYEVRIHRLAAVAWFGWGAVVDKHVHHKNDTPWDNREENLEPMSMEEHASLHTAEHVRNSEGELMPLKSEVQR